MSFALSAGVTGLNAHQKMLDIAGNNLANVNTTAFKAKRITFSELLSETVKKASQPTGTSGGTNPQQMGSGVGVASISPNMTQGNIVNTGNPLDMAMEGEGYFVVSDGAQAIYTRAGGFAVDANSNLVDPSTGYIVQRIGAVGEAEGFQTAGSSNIKVPYDVAMSANATSDITTAGNLSSDGLLSAVQTNMLKSDTTFTLSNGSNAIGASLIKDLGQYTGTLASGTITFSGYKSDGTAFTDVVGNDYTDLTMAVDATTTIDDVLTYLNTDDGIAATDEIQTLTVTGAGVDSFTLSDGTNTTGPILFSALLGDVQTAITDAGLNGAVVGDVVCAGTLAGGMTITYANNLAGQEVTNLTATVAAGTPTVDNVETTKGRAVQGVLGSDMTASFTNGRIALTDTASGYSRSDLAMAWSGDGTLALPAYFENTTVGGDEVKNINITVYDSQGGPHVLSAAFVRTDVANTWDMVMTGVTGDVASIDITGNSDRRIRGIEFDANNGSLSGLNAAIGDTAQFTVTFAHDPSTPQVVTIDMGSTGQFNGLTQFAGNSTAVARDQDGYMAGSLSSVSVNNEGIIIGAFSNGIKKNIATMQIALFQNTSGLESIGSGYFTSSANSGGAVATQAMTGGAGSIHGGSLEKSNADVATEFVTMIQAQNGYQANARTIKVANDILRELTNLIR